MALNSVLTFIKTAGLWIITTMLCTLWSVPSFAAVFSPGSSNWYNNKITVYGNIYENSNSISSVALYINSTLLSNTSIITNIPGSDFTWSNSIDSGIYGSNGTNNLDVYAVNTNNETNSKKYLLLLDTNPPVNAPSITPSDSDFHRGLLSLSGNVTEAHSGLAAIQLRLPGDSYRELPVNHVSGDIYSWHSNNINTVSVFSNGINNISIIAADNALPALKATNSYQIKIDNTAPFNGSNIVPAPGQWHNGDIYLAGTNTEDAAAITNILFSGGSITSRPVNFQLISPGTYTWETNLNSLTVFTNGINTVELVSVNNAVPAHSKTNSYNIRIDNTAPMPAGSITPPADKWIRGVTLLQGFISEDYAPVTNIMIKFPGYGFSKAPFSNTASLTWSWQTNADTALFSNGSNTIIVTARNESDPGQTATNSYPVLIDNEPPLITSFTVSNIKKNSADLYLQGNDPGTFSGFSNYMLSNHNTGALSYTAVSPYTINGLNKNTDITLSAFSVDRAGNTSTPLTQTFSYELILSNEVENGASFYQQKNTFNIIFKDELDQATVNDNNVYLAAVNGTQTNKLFTVLEYTTGTKELTVTPLLSLGQGTVNLLIITTGLTTAADNIHFTSNRHYYFETYPPLSAAEINTLPVDSAVFVDLKPRCVLNFPTNLHSSAYNYGNFYFYKGTDILANRISIDFSTGNQPNEVIFYPGSAGSRQ